jgi:hypothetical protein
MFADSQLRAESWLGVSYAAHEEVGVWAEG